MRGAGRLRTVDTMDDALLYISTPAMSELSGASWVAETFDAVVEMLLGQNCH